MADGSAFALGLDGKFEVYISLFKCVKNASEIKTKALKGQIPVAIIRPALVRRIRFRFIILNSS